MLLDKLDRLRRTRIVLASGSPRRRELLSGLGLDVEVITSTFAEDLVKTEPETYVLETARHKALEVAGRLKADGRRTLLVAADTIVVKENQILEKPRDRQHAHEILRLLSGSTHRVLTAVVLIVIDENAAVQLQEGFVEQTQVRFANLSDSLIDAYIATGEPMDKAGGYGIQGLGGTLIEGINGCYFNVVGFPIHKFTQQVASLMDSHRL